MRRLPAIFGRLSGVGRAQVPDGPKTQITKVSTVPSPVGGWNARDPKAAMDPRDAVDLINFFPRVADVILRPGEEDYATGFSGRPKALPKYTPPSGIDKFFATTDIGVYDISAAGPVGAPAVVCTNGYWNWVQMGTSAGAFLLMFNGTDAPLYYNGSAWASITAVSVPIAITGVPTTSLISAAIYKRRLFMVQTGDLGFWFLDADAIGGAADHFLLGPLCQGGGFLMAIGTWSFDGGNGPDDYAVFVTSEGEVVIFTGTDPADADNWQLVGTYFVGKPVGRKCLEKYGGDLVLLTQFGAFPLSKALLSATIDYKMALTNKIEGAFVEAARTYFNNQGWDMTILPNQSAFIFNIPTLNGGATAEQYVMNTTTKMWGRFQAWNASCFEVFADELYFADETRVAKAWLGTSDHGQNITAFAQTAYQNFGSSTQLKFWGLFRPMVLTDGTLNFSIGMSIDFEPNAALIEASFASVQGAVWDVSLWDDSFWAQGLEIKADWRTPSAKPGYWASMLFEVVSNSLEVQWVANDYTYQIGGVVG